MDGPLHMAGAQTCGQVCNRTVRAQGENSRTQDIGLVQLMVGNYQKIEVITNKIGSWLT
jgi:hypothetical protein